MQHGTSQLRAGWQKMPSQLCVPRRRCLRTFTLFALGSVGTVLHMFRARTSVPAVQPVHSTLRRTAMLHVAGLAAGPFLPASALVGSTLSPEIEEAPPTFLLANCWVMLAGVFFCSRLAAMCFVHAIVVSFWSLSRLSHPN
ncbi:unnamed protein product [Symbiodinium sp. CCMP2592]|nr:unnamed protein product [Symbiodinium sp. CCMP2592]